MMYSTSNFSTVHFLFRLFSYIVLQLKHKDQAEPTHFVD